MEEYLALLKRHRQAEERKDYRAAMVVAATYNVNRKRKKPYTPEEILGIKKEKKAKTPEDMLKAAKAWTQLLGGGKPERDS